MTELEQRLESLKAVLPEQKDVAEILRRVQGLATQSNLSIQRFTPQPPKQQPLYAELPYKLQAEGTYHDLGALPRSDQQVPPDHQRQRDLDQGEAAASSRTRPSSPNCVATTFVLQEGKPPAAKPVAQPAAQAMSHQRSPASPSTVAASGSRDAAGGAGAAAAAAPVEKPAPPRTVAARSPTRSTDGAIRSSAWSGGARIRDIGDVRPAGLPGMLINEVSLKGIMKERTGFVAMLQGPDKKTYVVRPGQRCSTAASSRSRQDAVVFSQDVNDPLSLVKQREVRKTLEIRRGEPGMRMIV